LFFEFLGGEAGAKAGDGFEFVEGAAGVAEGAPDIMGTTTPAAAARGATMRLVLSPTPPVECLSTLTPGMEERSTVSPERQHAFREAADFAVGHPEKKTALEKTTSVIGNVALV